MTSQALHVACLMDRTPLYAPVCPTHGLGPVTRYQDGAVFNAAVHNSDVPHVDADEMGTVSLLEGLT